MTTYYIFLTWTGMIEASITERPGTLIGEVECSTEQLADTLDWMQAAVDVQAACYLTKWKCMVDKQYTPKDKWLLN